MEERHNLRISDYCTIIINRHNGKSRRVVSNHVFKNCIIRGQISTLSSLAIVRNIFINCEIYIDIGGEGLVVPFDNNVCINSFLYIEYSNKIKFSDPCITFARSFNMLADSYVWLLPNVSNTEKLVFVQSSLDLLKLIPDKRWGELCRLG